MRSYAAARRDGWDWFEPDLSYDNARLCEALLKAGQTLGDRAMIEVGLATLDWLVGVQTGPRGSFRPVGSNGFGRPYSMPLAYDQQPLEAAATIDAAATAFTITGDARWERVARDAFGWFFGDNDGGIPLADVATGGCYDGLMATGINRNQGAEFDPRAATGGGDDGRHFRRGTGWTGAGAQRTSARPHFLTPRAE